jgi:hypothetical protein
MKKPTKNRHVSLAAMLFLAFAAFCVSSCAGEEDWLDIKVRLEPAVSDLAKLPAKTELVQAPVIKGKLIVIESAGYGAFINDIYFDELKDVFARKPKEVGTVALINCTKVQDGVYRSKEDPGTEVPAYKTTCEMNLIDRAKQAVVFKKTFSAQVEEEARGRGNYVFAGAETQFEMRSFLKGLPRN